MRGRELTVKGPKRSFLGDGNCFLIVVVISDYAFVKNHQSITFKVGEFYCI